MRFVLVMAAMIIAEAIREGSTRLKEEEKGPFSAILVILIFFDLLEIIL